MSEIFSIFVSDPAREEDFAGCIFEWVKTEQAGMLSKFAGFVTENDVEYTVFQDGNRIRTSLIGDIVIKHRDESTLLMINSPENNERNHITSAVSVAPNPLQALIKKSKKKKEKVQLEMDIEMPSSSFVSLMKDSFDNMEDEILEFVISQVNNEKLRESVKRMLKKKYMQNEK
jgi:hypothetical protein